MNIAILIAIAFIACDYNAVATKLRKPKQNKKSTIDVLAIVERTDYETIWLPMNNGDHNKTMDSLSSFYSHVFMGVEKRFKSSKKLIKLKDIYVEQKSETILTLKTESPKKTTDNLKKWLNAKGNEFENINVFLIFTSKTVKPPKCNNKTPFVIVQNGDLVSSIKEFADSSKVQQCLKKIKASGSTSEGTYLMDKYKEEVAGQRFPLHDQCRIGFGIDSEPCAGNNNHNQSICQGVYCSSGEKCKMIVPADGTLCGDNRWCKGGACEGNDKAPKLNDDKCEDKDKDKPLWTVLGPASCLDIVKNQSYICEQEYFSHWCCKSCSSKCDKVAKGPNYVIKALVVVDNSFYENWRSFNYEINQTCYLNIVMDGVTKRLKTIDQSVTVKMKDLYVIEKYSRTGIIQFFQENSDNVWDRPINTKKTRDAFHKWLPSSTYANKDYNAVIIYTRHTLNSIGVSAINGSFCKNEMPVILVTIEKGLYNVIDATAHGLGLSLGASRDGDLNSCSQLDQYIMTPRRNYIDPKNYDNHLKFSDCSVRDVKAFLKQQNCLTSSEVECEDPFEDKCDLKHAGQKYNIEWQCKFGIAWYSSLCIGNYVKESDICKDVYCYSKTSFGASCELVVPVDGTTCGSNKWCQDGKCVHSDAVPSFDTENCTDRYEKGMNTHRSVFGTKRCSKLKSDDDICDHDYYKHYCCETCEKSN